MAGNLIFLIFSVYCVAQISIADNVNKKTEDIETANPTEHNKGCGWRNVNGIGEQINHNESNEALFGEFPWMVGIFTEVMKPHCGGSIIAPNVVLTSTDCALFVRDKNNLNEKVFVRGGEYDIENENETLKHVDIAVKEVITHENYDKYTGYDIGLLILNESFVWQENIRPICLPEPNLKFDGQRCYASGWAKFAHYSKNQFVLNKIDLPIVPHDQCQNIYAQLNLRRFKNVHESFLCAGGEKGKDICEGGSGSPLVCSMPGVKDRYYHVGIVSKGIGCGHESAPALYSNVSYLRNWISEKLKSQNISI